MPPTYESLLKGNNQPSNEKMKDYEFNGSMNSVNEFAHYAEAALSQNFLGNQTELQKKNLIKKINK